MDKVKSNNYRDELLKQLNLTREEAIIIRFMYENGALSLEDLQKGTGLDRKRLKDIIKRLISKRYVSTLVMDSRYQL